MPIEQTFKRLQHAVFEEFTDRAAPPLTVRRALKVGRTNGAFIKHQYGNLETLIKISVQDRLDAIDRQLASIRSDAVALEDRVAALSSDYAALLNSDAYRRLTFALIRDACTRPWLVKKHDALIDKMGRAAARLIESCPAPAGVRVSVRYSAVREFIMVLRKELSLVTLLPGCERLTERGVSTIAASAAMRLLEGTCLISSDLFDPRDVGRIRPLTTPAYDRRIEGSAAPRPAGSASGAASGDIRTPSARLDRDNAHSEPGRTIGQGGLEARG